MAPNVLGKDPPKVKDDEEELVQPSEPTVDLTPLEDIIELIVLIHDESANGEGGQSHVTVCYRDTVAVKPPRWYELENQPPQVGGGRGRVGPQDSLGAARGRGRSRRGRGNTNVIRANKPLPPTPSTAGRHVAQTLWVAGDGSKKFEATLWPPFEHIKLVRVAKDARSGFFVRMKPPPADGQPAPPLEEEELFKSTMQLSQEVLKEIAGLQRGVDVERMAAGQATAGSQWQDVEETTRINGIYHLGRKDQDAFATDEDSFISSINVDAYQSRTGGNLRGLRVMNISPEIQGRFGVQVGDLILAVNGQSVSTKAQAVTVGKKLYRRGVRRFTVTLLSNGQEIERIYQAPDQ